MLSIGLLINPTQAQSEDRKSADQIYKDYGYKASIPLYQGKQNVSVEEMAKIANAYRLNHDTENAEFWYSQFIHKTKDPQHLFHYAQALQSNGKFDIAKQYYLQYDEKVGAKEGADQRGRLLAEAIDKMEQLQHTEIQIKNESLINTDKLEFSPAYYKNGIIFVSTRGAQSTMSENAKDIWIDDNFMALFYAERNDDGNLNNAVEFSLDLTTIYHEGPVCFAKNGERIFFTRNDYINETRRNSSDGTMKLQIYSAFKDGDSWSTPTELPFNTVEHEEAHPALSPDGTKLYFSSDRPGGLGGMDLYVSTFENGSWGEPVNMGKTINTPGNEVFPWMHDDGTLYYASNGWGGLGGLDIFSTTSADGETWSAVENVGTPFNSKKDDFGLVFNLLKTEGYLTSARRNGAGQDDIYSFLMPKSMPTKVQICAYEAGTDKRLSDVEVEIVEQFDNQSTNGINTEDMVMTLEQTNLQNEYVLKFKQRGLDISENDVVKTFTTNEEGIFQAYLKKDRKYLLVATKDGYQVGKAEVDGASFKGLKFHEFCVPLEMMDCMNLDGVVKHKKYGNEISGATVTMTNLCTGDDVVVTSDKDGYFKFPCIPCGCDYLFKASKNSFSDGASQENTIGDNCKMGTTISTVLLLDNDVAQLKETFAGIKLEGTFAGVKLEEGAVIELENIYYDFDQYYIREDAKDELDHVIELLTVYPSLVIELSSHTDARATHAYNETLSQNRAKAAVDYIISKGIDRRRLVAKGYGERQLKNHCANYVECSEEDHQRNRRTEIKVLKFDRKDIQVTHIDNNPESIDPADPKRKFVWE